MYNEQVKTRFIRQYTDSVTTATLCQRVFEATAKYEEEWQADLCTKTKEEVQPLVDEIAGLRAKSKTVRVIILKEYAKWCLAVEIPGACDGILNVDTIGTEQLRFNMVSNPLMLQQYLDILYEPESKQTSNDIYRCFFWLAFAGVNEEDALGIKCSDVDFENMVIKYKGLNVPIYREAIPTFRNCATLKSFVYSHPSYKEGTIVYMDRPKGDTLIRGIRKVPTINAFRTRISLTTKDAYESGKTKLRLSYHKVWLSGLFYRMYERESAGIPVDFYEAAERFTAGKTYNFSKTRNTFEAKKRQVAREFMQDYRRWKVSFNL